MKYTMSTVVAARDRGKWGDASYPGSCSGYPIKLMLLYFKPRNVLDPMEGGGTCRDVCNEMGIPYTGYDIVNGQDMFVQVFKEKYDFIHWHPPYFKMKVDGYNKLCNSPSNLCNYTVWSAYVDKVLEGFELLFNQLDEGGVLAILTGQRRISGRVFDIASHLITCGEKSFIGEIVKLQTHILHKAQFGSGYSKLVGHEGVAALEDDLGVETFKPRTFHGHPFILIVHEKYLLFRNGKQRGEIYDSGHAGNNNSDQNSRQVEN